MMDWKAAHRNVKKALHITQHDRNDKAGDAEDNFYRIALCWTAMLSDTLMPGEVVTAPDTARMMITMKMCRDAHMPHNDNRIDAHGYTLCLDRVEPLEDE